MIASGCRGTGSIAAAGGWRGRRWGDAGQAVYLHRRIPQAAPDRQLDRTLREEAPAGHAHRSCSRPPPPFSRLPPLKRPTCTPRRWRCRRQGADRHHRLGRHGVLDHRGWGAAAGIGRHGAGPRLGRGASSRRWASRTSTSSPSTTESWLRGRRGGRGDRALSAQARRSSAWAVRRRRRPGDSRPRSRCSDRWTR